MNKKRFYIDAFRCECFLPLYFSAMRFQQFTYFTRLDDAQASPDVEYPLAYEKIHPFSVLLGVGFANKERNNAEDGHFPPSFSIGERSEVIDPRDGIGIYGRRMHSRD